MARLLIVSVGLGLVGCSGDSKPTPSTPAATKANTPPPKGTKATME